MGGLIQRQIAAGVEVVVLAVTDGEAAYERRGDTALAEIRRAEQHRAIATLAGRDTDHDVLGPDIVVQRLGVSDGLVTEHEDDVIDALHELVVPESLIVAPWGYDHHPDHEAAGRAALRVALARDATLVGSLFWAWQHGELSSVDGNLLLGLQLTADERCRKRAAIRCHRSQLHTSPPHDPILDPGSLAVTEWDQEYYVEVVPGVVQ